MLFLAQTLLSDKSLLLGFELNKDLFKESAKRIALFAPEVENVTVWQRDIMDISAEMILDFAKGLPIVLFSFDALFPRHLTSHIYSLFGQLPKGTKLLSTWTDHYYSFGIDYSITFVREPKSEKVGCVYIGPPGVVETDPNVIINVSLSPDNFPVEEFERLDEAEQELQLARAKAFSK